MLEEVSRKMDIENLHLKKQLERRTVFQCNEKSTNLSEMLKRLSCNTAASIPLLRRIFGKMPSHPDLDDGFTFRSMWLLHIAESRCQRLNVQ